MKFATRPYYYASNNPKMQLINAKDVKFEYFSGFARERKQKSIESMHKAIKKLYPQAKILEISKASPNQLGQKLSAFNLKLKVFNGIQDITASVERFFQGSKVFNNGGPFEEIIFNENIHPKKYDKLKKGCNFQGFKLFGKCYSTEPVTFFYDWLYINALKQNSILATELENYDIFTDIEFNPNKSLSCQAAAVALFLSLKKAGTLDKATKTSDEFLKLRLSVIDNQSLF